MYNTTDWAAPIGIVGWDEESELEQSSLIEAPPDSQQTIPD